MAALKEKKKRQKYWLWYTLAETDLYEMVERSGFGEKEFVLFQKRRLVRSLLSSLVALIPGIVLNKWFLLLGFVFPIYMWRNLYSKEKKEYQQKLYQKTLTWKVFQRFVAIHLRGAHTSVSSVFKKLMKDINDEEFKRNIQQFLIDIVEDPSDVQPYINFAENAGGGRDEAFTFMTALYNYQRHARDSSIIDELSDVARLEMMEGIKDIRETKEKGFYLIPTYLTMTMILPIFGFMIGMAVNIFTHSMNF